MWPSTLVGQRLQFALFLMCCINSSALAQEYTKKVGGAGGVRYAYLCQPGTVLIGVEVQSGSWINRVRGRCHTVTAYGWMSDLNRSMLLPSNWNSTDWAGQFDFTAFTGRPTMCGQDYVVAGFESNAATYVHALKLRCYKISAGLGLSGTATYPTAVGAEGGTSQVPHECSAGRMAIGIHGTAGLYVDSFGLICDYVAPWLGLKSPISGTAMSNRPVFTWEAARYSKPFRISINSVEGIMSKTTSSAVVGTTDGTSWQPTVNLPYRSGTAVRWTVESCNLNKCVSQTATFTMP